MTYNEVAEQIKTMPSFSGMHLTIKQATPGNENTYYPDYVPNNPMFGCIEYRIYDCFEREDFSRFNEPKHKTTPPSGRDQKQHNLIQSMNRRKRFR